MTRHRHLLATPLTVLLTLAAGCGGPAPCPEAEGAFACVDGATLALASKPSCAFPLASSEGVEARTAKALEIAGRVWGVDPGDYLTGWTIDFCGGWFVCGRAGSATWTYGCASPDDERLDAAPGPSGCLAGVLIHELGHVVVGDLTHRDPRFETANALEAAPCE
jgi:hypothetical protein